MVTEFKANGDVLFAVGDVVELKGTGREMLIESIADIATQPRCKDAPIFCQWEQDGQTLRRGFSIEVLTNKSRKPVDKPPAKPGR